MAFGDIFNKIKDNTQRFVNYTTSDEFQNKFKSPFGQQPGPEPAAEPLVPAVPDLSQIQQESRQVTGPHRDMSTEMTPSAVGMPSGVDQASGASMQPESTPLTQPVPPVNNTPALAPQPEAPAVPSNPALANGQQVGNTNTDVANAKAGDWIIRSNGQTYVLKQSDIDWAKGKIAAVPAKQEPPKKGMPEDTGIGAYRQKSDYKSGADTSDAKVNGASAANGNLRSSTGSKATANKQVTEAEARAMQDKSQPTAQPVIHNKRADKQARLSAR